MYQAFFLIGSGRQYNEAGPQPIALAEIITWLDESQIVDRADRAECVKLLRALDNKYLALAHEKMARDRDRLLAKARSGKV